MRNKALEFVMSKNLVPIDQKSAELQLYGNDDGELYNFCPSVDDARFAAQCWVSKNLNLLKVEWLVEYFASPGEEQAMTAMLNAINQLPDEEKMCEVIGRIFRLDGEPTILTSMGHRVINDCPAQLLYFTHWLFDDPEGPHVNYQDVLSVDGKVTLLNGNLFDDATEDDTHHGSDEPYYVYNVSQEVM